MTPEQAVLEASHAWDRAMVTNDPAAIGAWMADDWVIIGPDGRVIDKEAFLDVVRSGRLSHSVLETHEPDIRVYGDAAVVVARGISGGTFDGAPFHLTERVTCVFIRQDDTWRCVLTHLSTLA